MDRERAALRSYVASLRWKSGEFEVVPDGSSTTAPPRHRPPPLGFVLHSVLGPALRAPQCPDPATCEPVCPESDRCLYALIYAPFGSTAPAGTKGLESGPPAADDETPTSAASRERGGRSLTGPEGAQDEIRAPFLARIPAPLVLDAPWDGGAPAGPVRFRLALLGSAAQHADAVLHAVRRAMGRGLGRERGRYRVTRAGWTDLCGTALCNVADRLAKAPCLESAPAAVARPVGEGRIRLELASPLRLVRDHHPLRRFSLPDLARDLNFRLAAWGRFHGGLPWAPPWTFLQSDARRAEVDSTDCHWIEFRRYSGRQRRSIALGGLLGEVVLGGASAELATLLAVGTVCGAGKGGSVGLGRLRMRSA